MNQTIHIGGEWVGVVGRPMKPEANKMNFFVWIKTFCVCPEE